MLGRAIEGMMNESARTTPSYLLIHTATAAMQLTRPWLKTARARKPDSHTEETFKVIGKNLARRQA